MGSSSQLSPREEPIRRPERPAIKPNVTGHCFFDFTKLSCVYLPRFCPYSSQPFVQEPSHLSPRVQHDTVSKLWYGARPKMAEELMVWERLVREFFEDYFKKQIEQHYLDTFTQPSENQEGRNDIPAIHSGIIDINEFTGGIISFAWRQGFRPDSSLLAARGLFFDTMKKFVLTHDCLTPTLACSPSMSVKAHITSPDRSPTTSGGGGAHASDLRFNVKMISNPDYLIFEHPFDSVEERTMVRLYPRYHSPSMEGTGYAQFAPQNIIFTASVGWLNWDSRVSALCGAVPSFNDMNDASRSGAIEVLAPYRPPGDRSPPARYEVQVSVKGEFHLRFPENVDYRTTVKTKVRFTVTSRTVPGTQGSLAHSTSYEPQVHLLPNYPMQPQVQPPVPQTPHLPLRGAPRQANANFYSHPTMNYPPPIQATPNFAPPVQGPISQLPPIINALGPPVPGNNATQHRWPHANRGAYRPRGYGSPRNPRYGIPNRGHPNQGGQWPNRPGPAPASGDPRPGSENGGTPLNPNAAVYTPRMHTQTMGSGHSGEKDDADHFRSSEHRGHRN